MHMSFYWTTDLGDFFFEGLKINSVTSLAILCGTLAFVSIVYEAIKVHSASVRARAAREQIAAVSCAPSETANLLVTDQNGPKQSFSKRFCKLLSEATVFLFHNSIGYALMLSVMVYSGWLFLTVVLSMGLGYFLFGHISMKINMENVQARTTSVVCSPACPEMGGSSDVSKNPSPCRSISYQVNQQQQEEPTTSSGLTYTTATLPVITCHQEKVVHTVNSELDEDCSCRL